MRISRRKLRQIIGNIQNDIMDEIAYMTSSADTWTSKTYKGDADEKEPDESEDEEILQETRRHVMKATRRQLKYMIQEALEEGYRMANVSEISRHKETVREWVETLVDDLAANQAPKLKDASEKQKADIVNRVTDDVIMSLITTLGHMTAYGDRKQKRKEEEEILKNRRQKIQTVGFTPRYGEGGAR